jgi:predicted SnoaL-like aldol condensation-catalyzing enzyme
MKLLTPSRLIAVAAIAVAILSLGVASARTGPDRGDRFGDHPRGGHPSKACVAPKWKLERNKRNVVGFYTTALNDKNPRRAVHLYGGPEYIQHNPLADNGFDAFIAFFGSFTSQFPDARIDIRRVFAECDFVITHGLLTGAVPVYTERGSKVVDIFRLNSRGKIVEHWDVLAPISATSANGNPEV